ncbi:MAG TPA: HAMP domain-containing sensor histidine kinase, partial [Flavobacteriales bacterium]|nr:HAMP domain-containing sensor histidine kinase [Flavobacteriales bacterium]
LKIGAGAEQTELIDFAEQQYFKAMRSSEELLDGFEVERGVGTLKYGAVDLSALTKACIDAIVHRLERKQQRLTLHRDAVLTVDGDAHWLEQLINALLTNASKFTPIGGNIDVHLSREGSSAVIIVSDNGVGLDETDLGNVFVRYAWLKSRSTNGEAQGRSTLGRALQWARAHGGDLIASSQGPGKGSRFTVTLPIKD